LITAHVYEDGNKRTAWLAATWILHTSGKRVATKHGDTADVLRHVSRYDADELATWLREGEIDRSRLRSPD
jgi:death-on-curing protein